MNKIPTMKDVAREAGVSLGTVSKVINGISVGPDYKEKVNCAIDKLRYEVNTYARGLKMQHTNILTLIVPNILNPFYSTFANYIESFTYQKGYKLILCCSDGLPDKEIEYLNLAKQSKTDGIIALTYSDIGNPVPSHIPLVTFDRYFKNSAIPRISSDNFSGGILAVNKLLELGCKRPVFIRFHSTFSGEADKRMLGYLEACKINQIVPDCLDVIDSMEVKPTIKKFILDHKNSDGSLNFDGIFANTDYHGYAALKILQELGYDVPNDVQIIGFDGITKFGDINGDLFISSICQPIAELAKLCVETILLDKNDIIPSVTLLPVLYRWGGTTKKD